MDLFSKWTYKRYYILEILKVDQNLITVEFHYFSESNRKAAPVTGPYIDLEKEINCSFIIDWQDYKEVSTPWRAVYSLKFDESLMLLSWYLTNGYEHYSQHNLKLEPVEDLNLIINRLQEEQPFPLSVS